MPALGHPEDKELGFRFAAHRRSGDDKLKTSNKAVFWAQLFFKYYKLRKFVSKPVRFFS